jgi:anti-sigma regulatory factor (Ser/Thr protein kinase)
MVKVSVITDTRANSDSGLIAQARLPAVQGSVARAIAHAMLFADRAGVPVEAAQSLAIIVEEWVVNVVEHGAADPGSLITLRFERRGGDVRVTICDAGSAFDPRGVEMAGPNEERGGGAGIALIQAWSRILDYRRRGGRNRLVLQLV